MDLIFLTTHLIEHLRFKLERIVNSKEFSFPQYFPSTFIYTIQFSSVLRDIQNAVTGLCGPRSIEMWSKKVTGHNKDCTLTRDRLLSALTLTFSTSLCIPNQTFQMERPSFLSDYLHL